MTLTKALTLAGGIALLAALAGVAAGSDTKSKQGWSVENAMKKQTALKVVCIGDSITGQPDLSKYMKFSHILELMIEARCGYGAVTVVNKGIGGDTSEGVLKRLDTDVIQEKPDIVVILIGGNDVAVKTTMAKTKANLDQIYGALQKAGIRILALQYHVLPNPQSPDTAWATLDDNNDIIAETAKAHGAAVLDMSVPMKDALNRLSQPELVSASDGVHLSPGGELVFARMIFQKLDRLGWLPRRQT